VLIGPTAIDLQDYYLSPVSAGVRMAGVEVHANNIQTLITGKFLRDQSNLSLWLTLFGLLLLNLFVFNKLRVRFAVPLFVFELASVLVAGIVAYEFLIFVNVVYPILTVLLSFIGVFLLRFILEQKERKFIEGAFGHYVNQEVVDQILKDPSTLELGGAKREITTFFSDIAGFTSISEKMEPAQLVDFLNGYLGEMTTIILNQKGTLDKYEGDAIMAYWGAPLPSDDHAKRACMAALENQKKLAEMRIEWEKQGLPPIHVRIGLNTGEAIAGNMGSENRFDYTVMGDNVNLASRLESINKQYDSELMVSEYTYEPVKDDFVFRELDQIRVKGKEKPVRIYELVALVGEVPAEKQSVIAAFAEGLALYRQKAFTEALAKFQSIENDAPSAVFAKRCSAFIKNPPTEDWDGVYTFTVK
jgi:adenylate cyclase